MALQPLNENPGSAESERALVTFWMRTLESWAHGQDPLAIEPERIVASGDNRDLPPPA